MKYYTCLVVILIFLGTSKLQAQCQVFAGDSPQGIVLNLTPSDKTYQLIQNVPEDENRVVVNTLDKGRYTMSADYLLLISSGGQRVPYKMRSDEYVEIVNRSTAMPVKFFCSRMYYSNGTVKWKGNWMNGLKHNVWFFYDSTGRHIDTKYYEKGIEKKVVLHPSLLPH